MMIQPCNKVCNHNKDFYCELNQCAYKTHEVVFMTSWLHWYGNSWTTLCGKPLHNPIMVWSTAYRESEVTCLECLRLLREM